ncbi:MAG: LysM peptidoglycan-binding domain-containing protein [Solirubrobacterales bacterium]|nr:LysM peptidoglycan-binding domain-containing protein [Solirubrobacterales bacterium]
MLMSRWTRGSARRRSAPRALATLLCAALLCASLAPAPVWAEAETEGEGAGPPGPPPIGFEEPGELGGEDEETALEEVAPESGEEITEEVVPIGPEEPAPSPEVPVAPAPAPVEEVEAPAPEAETVAPPAVEPEPPGYEAEPATPAYEAAPAPGGAVENQTLVAPQAHEGKTHRAHKHEATSASPETIAPEVTESPPSPPGPEPVAAAEPTFATAPEKPHSLAGSRSHTVRPGECLWSIAEGVLPAGASDARTAAEVARLWSLNAARIGTGDPNLIMVGTVLRVL